MINLNSRVLKKKSLIMFVALAMMTFYSVNAQRVVSSLAELQSAIQLSDQDIVLSAGNYNIEVLSSNSRFFHCTGSNNTIDLTGVYIEFPIGSSRDQHFLITGDNNILRGGEFENTYDNGMTEVTDFVAYNNDKSNLAYGADPHLVIQGDGNTVIGMKLTIRGSFPYGYGSMYGIGSDNVFGLSKRGGIAVQGTNVIIDSCELQMKAFGHGIYIQSPSNHTIVRNTIVEGEVRSGAEVLAETDASSLPFISNYLDFSEDFDNPSPIDPNNAFSLCEDGIRVYTNGGSVEVENCTVKKMRGGIRTYLSSGATVSNSVAIDCGATNFNMPNDGTITESSGNFAFGPVNDNRLGRSRQDIELTIIPSPNALGAHNIADIIGNDQNIVFHRTPGPLDDDEERAIVITGDNSTIVNETEYTIILESSANGNTITSCGPVTDNGSGNDITIGSGCLDIPSTGEGTLVHVTKRNATGYAIDGGSGETNGQIVTLSSANIEDEDQLWLEIDRGDGYYSYEKYGTNYSLDGNKGGANNQLLHLWETSATNQNQQWLKQSIGDGSYKLIKRNATGFTMNGGSGGVEGRNISLWNSSVNNQNLQWYITPVVTAEIVRLEAEDYDTMSGIQAESSIESGENVGYINDGDWLRFDDVNLSGITNMDARVATRTSGGTIEVRIGGLTGTLIGTIDIDNTGGFQNWITLNTSISNVTGMQDVYLVFRGGDEYLYNINWIEFNIGTQSNKEITATKINENTLELYPNPTTVFFQIEATNIQSVEVYNISGELIKSFNESLDTYSIEDLATGIYMVKTRKTNGILNTNKLIKF